MTLAFAPPRRRLPIRRQQGAVLIVAMIVLIALALAALSLLRSVDVLGLVSSNLAFKRSALDSTDVGVSRALAQYITVADKTIAPVTTSGCYSPTMLPTTTRGVPTVLAGSGFATAYPNCTLASQNGETVSYIVDRQCNTTGIPSRATCLLAQSVANNKDDKQMNVTEIVIPAYRVTVRVEGAKNAASFSQVIFY